MYDKVLTKSGLDRKQAKIYLACLEVGPASVPDIAKKAGIKPIIGCEMYITENMYDKRSDSSGRAYYHLIVLAKNNVGYRNLIKLVTASNLEGYYYKPRIDKNLLRKHSEGLIGLSACLAGELSRALMGSNPERAEKLAYEYQDIFGKGNYFIEIQQHKHIDDQNVCTPRLIELARKTGIPMVATQDSHYCRPTDNHVHDVLLAVQTGNQVGDKDRLSLIHDNFSITDAQYMADMFPDVPEALENTGLIADMCNVELEFGKHKLPVFPIPEGFQDDNAYLRHLCEQGLPERYGDKVDASLRERLEYELGIITKMGFSSYFLIVQDYVNWAKNNGVITGPGRGSAAGSLIAYLLRITNIDPIKYNLLFERFLNPERVSMPDIDVDFDDARRGDVFNYVRQKYGADHFAQIITFGTMAARGSVRDAGRALGYPYELCDKISKLIPMNPNQGKKKGALEAAVEEVPDLKQLYQTNADVKKIVDVAKHLEGVARHCSTHACAVVIAPEPLTEYLPLQKGTNEGDIITQYEMHAVEDLGLVKMDFLGLSNLTIIEKALKLIEKNLGVKLNLDKVPLDDEKSFRLLQSAHTTGVFQLESSGMKRYLKALKPNNVDDLIVMVSLYRPGPLDAGMVEEYIERKHGRKPVTYLHPSMEPILANTYGIIVYQEQLMQIANNLGKFSLGQGYMLIKAVGKKIKALLDEQKSKLVDGMVGNNIEKHTAEKIWDFIEPFARYGFNKCLTGDTEIFDYRTGKYIKLIDIVNGDQKIEQVLSLDNSYKLIPQKVKALHRNGLKKVYKLTTKSGRTIRATANHPFFGTDGWINLSNLNPGDQIAVPKELKNGADIYWDQIRSIEEDGEEETFDLEIEGLHNFVANNIIVHNSHAACYAMIGYQTAYLKANYPVEFMAALLNSSSDDIERIAFLIEECKTMKIDVLAPHINESEQDFSVVTKGENRGKIRFGLAAIKNVGTNIVSEIIKERESGGKFERIEDLVSRVKSKDLNKKSLESLIKGGALDCLGERGQLLGNMDTLLEFSRAQNKAANTMQISLFDSAGPVAMPALKLNDVEPIRRIEKLMWEKELLGLFISDHPLKDYMSRLTDNDLMTIKDVVISKRKTGVKIAGMVIKTQKIITKTGKNMAFSTIEDMTSKLELVIFPSVYDQFPGAFEENAVLIATGKMDLSGETPKMLCDSVRLITSLA